MKLSIASDHTGVALKKIIKETFTDIEFIDFGTYSSDPVDYPDFIVKAVRAVQKGEVERGIVICGTGVGASIVANKIRGIRAALCNNQFTAEMTRRHNNANILALGARVTGEELALAIVKCWIETGYEGGRHQHRLDKISEIEKEECR